MKLNKNWKFRILPNCSEEKSFGKLIENKWYCAEVPGTIHTDLMTEGIIDDPFYSDNELKISWINNYNWEYELQFNSDSINLSKEYSLLFEGLDTIAEIRLNGELLGNADNMFIEHRYSVTKLLKDKNILKIVFQSPINYGKKLESEMGKLQVALASERVYLRKAQYSFGWDWGPSFPTVGIWKDVYLIEEPTHKIDDVKFDTLNISKNHADLLLQFNLAGELEKVERLEINLCFEDSEKKDIIENISDSQIVHSIKLDSPKLWYPNGLGDANLYNLSIKVFDHNNNSIAVFKKNVGIRKTELILKNENEENSFYFKINNSKVFIKGVNWIPADSFLPRVDSSKYDKLLSLAKDANVNMVRVWGGGVYENDEFYNICDRLGLLVWQDFMFACGAYPEHNKFIENVTEEVKQNVIRLRLHPSIAIWCGNNENEWGWTQNETLPIEEMSGYKIYHKIIPNLLQSLDNIRPYWPSSPFGNSIAPNNSDEGNTHQWNIWSMWQDYTEVKNDKSKFVSEFGFQGPANLDTFKKCLPKENYIIQDRLFEFHNKQVEGPERLTRFLSGHLPLVTEFEDYIYLTQLNQGFALKTCIEHWRSNDVTNGSIIWQLNDCWPVTSWAIVDSEIKPKLAYHFVKNIFNNIILLINEKENTPKLIVKNDGHKEFRGTLSFSLIELQSSETIEKLDVEIEVSPFKSKIILNEWFEKIDENKIMVFTIYDETSGVVNRNYFIKGRWKHKKILKPEISYDFSKINENKLFIESNNLALFIDLYHPEIVFEERGFILLGGEKREIRFTKLNDVILEIDKLKLRMLNQYL